MGQASLFCVCVKTSVCLQILLVCLHDHMFRFSISLALVYIVVNASTTAKMCYVCILTTTHELKLFDLFKTDSKSPMLST